MKDKPTIYAFCPAGCKYETIHADEFQRSAPFIKQELDVRGNASCNLIVKQQYKIYSNGVNADLTINRDCTNVNNKIIFGDIDLNTSGFAGVGKKIYFFGGSGSVDGVWFGDKIRVYDVETDTASILESTMPIPCGNAMTAVVGNKIYLFGGEVVEAVGGGTENVGMEFETIRCFDIETGVFETLAGTFAYGFSGSAIQTIGTKIYVVGGVGTGTQIRVYNTVTNSFENTSMTLPKGVYHPAVANIGSNLYIFGGLYDESSGVSDAIYCVDVDSGVVSTSYCKLPSRYNMYAYKMYASVLDDKIYLLGGEFTNGSYSEFVYLYDADAQYLTELKYNVGSNLFYAFATVDDKVYGFRLDELVVFTMGDYYTAKVKLVSGGKSYQLPIHDTYDRYYDYLYVTVLAIDADKIVFEINEVRYYIPIVFSGSIKFKLENANHWYKYNVEAMVAGEKGDSIWVRWADDENGTNIVSTRTNQNYIGIYVGKDPSTNPADYTWVYVAPPEIEVVENEDGTVDVIIPQ